MTDDRLDTILGSFYKSTARTPPDPSRSLGEVIARVPQTRQRSRWWPLPIVGRASVTLPVSGGPQQPSTPNPAPSGHSVRVTGRTQVMLSPVKVIITGAVVFALGGVFLIAQPFEQEGRVVPGAATDVAGESTVVTATASCGLVKSGTWQLASAPYSLTGHVLRCTETASDSRVTGTSTVVLNIEGWDEGLKNDNAANSVSWNDYTLEGPDGTWTGRGYGFYDDEQTAHGLTIAIGSGAYEGLTYTQSLTVPLGTPDAVSIGIIQTGSPAPGFPVAALPSPVIE